MLEAVDRFESFHYAAAQSAEGRASRLAAQSIRVRFALIVVSVLIGLGLAWRMLRSQRTTEATFNSTPDPVPAELTEQLSRLQDGTKFRLLDDAKNNLVGSGSP